MITLKENDYVRAAKALGARWYRVLARHMLPNTLGILIIAVFLELPGVILGEAFLSFIGLGIGPPDASWGSMAQDGYRAYRVDVLRELPLSANSDGFDFDTEIILQLVGAGKRIVEIPTPTFYGDEICHVEGVAYARAIMADTLRYRMERLREVTGRHPDDPDQRMELWLALRAHDALRARRAVRTT